MDKVIKKKAISVIALAAAYFAFAIFGTVLSVVANPEYASYLSATEEGRSVMSFIARMFGSFYGISTNGLMVIVLFILSMQSVRILKGQSINENRYNGLLAFALFWITCISVSSLFNSAVMVDYYSTSQNSFSASYFNDIISYYNGLITINTLLAASAIAVFIVSGFYKTVGDYFKGIFKNANAPKKCKCECECEDAPQEEPAEVVEVIEDAPVEAEVADEEVK